VKLKISSLFLDVNDFLKRKKIIFTNYRFLRKSNLGMAAAHLVAAFLLREISDA
jgi:hypothetical protein